MRKTLMMLACFAPLTQAFADQPAAPVTAGSFIALPADRSAAHGKPLAPLKTSPTQFIALSPRNFKPAVRLKPEAPAEVAADEMPAPPLHPVSQSGMTPQQAQQILSIFAPDR